MPTGDYILKDKKLPSVTTIIGRFKNAIGLIIWSNQLGLKGLNYFDELKKFRIANTCQVCKRRSGQKFGKSKYTS